jgi:hypothetical protein
MISALKLGTEHWCQPVIHILMRKIRSLNANYTHPYCEKYTPLLRNLQSVSGVGITVIASDTGCRTLVNFFSTYQT